MYGEVKLLQQIKPGACFWFLFRLIDPAADQYIWWKQRAVEAGLE